MAQRFPRKITIWTTEQQADCLELLARDGLLSVSDHARQAFQFYFNQIGIKPAARPMPNGQHIQAAE